MKPKFKKGDKVRLLRRIEFWNGRDFIRARVGNTGIITDILKETPYPYEIKLESGVLNVEEEEIELADYKQWSQV